MKNFFEKKIWLVFASVLILSIAFGSILIDYQLKKNIQEAVATKYDPPISMTDNVSGFAWNENIGWISFNSSDCDIDGNGIFGDMGAPAGCPPASADFHDYGVHVITAIINRGDYEGYAWSNNVGWIYFGPDADLAGYGPTSSSTAPTEPRTWAHLDLATGEVTGWAKILSMGDDGWIKLRNNPAAGEAAAYSVDYDQPNDRFLGYAWNANDDISGIGWISFNCIPDGDCVNEPYEVKGYINTPPEVHNMSAPNWSWEESCDSDDALRAYLKFQYVDIESDGIAYQIKAEATDSSLVLDTGKCNKVDGVHDNCQINFTTQPTCLTRNNYCLFPLTDSLFPNFDYNKSYTWEVAVWDIKDASSTLTAYDVPADTDNDDGDDFTFSTYKKEFPRPFFKWFTPDPSKGEKVLFTDMSSYLDNLQFLHGCDNANCEVEWIFPDTASTPETYYDASSTVHTFATIGDVQATSTVIDLEYNYSCSTSTKLDIKVKLPTWIEAR